MKFMRDEKWNITVAYSESENERKEEKDEFFE